MQTISAADLARNTDAILERIERGETLGVLRSGRVVAKIAPAQRTMTAQQAIAGVVGTLAPTEGKDWLDESRPTL